MKKSKLNADLQATHERTLNLIRQAANIQRDFIVECIQNNESSYYGENGMVILAGDMQVLLDHEKTLGKGVKPERAPCRNIESVLRDSERKANE